MNKLDFDLYKQNNHLLKIRFSLCCSLLIVTLLIPFLDYLCSERFFHQTNIGFVFSIFWRKVLRHWYRILDLTCWKKKLKTVLYLVIFHKLRMLKLSHLGQSLRVIYGVSSKAKHEKKYSNLIQKYFKIMWARQTDLIISFSRVSATPYTLPLARLTRTPHHLTPKPQPCSLPLYNLSFVLKG